MAESSKSEKQGVEKIINNLNHFAEIFREKGFEHQATLLETKSDSAYKYAIALAHPQWIREVRRTIGDGDYLRLEGSFSEHQGYVTDSQLAEIFDKSEARKSSKEQLKQISFKPRSYKTDPLTVGVSRKIDVQELEEAAKTIDELIELETQFMPMIYREVRSATEDNPNLLYEIYKDSFDYRDIAKDPDGVRQRIQNRIGRLEKNLEIEVIPNIIIKENLKLLNKVVPSFKYNDGKSLKENSKNLIDQAKASLKDKERFKENLKQIKKPGKDYILKKEKERLDMYEPENFKRLVQYDNPLTGNEDFCRNEFGTDVDNFQDLLKAQIKLRQWLVENYDSEIRFFRNNLVGMQQIVAGGLVTNPSASAVSAMQNDGYFPNIQYSDELKEKLKEFIESFGTRLDKLPDLNGITAPSKLKKKKALTYEMRELPKNPLDVTFGNDSGCCIFVPKDVKDLKNGYFVPYYLYDTNVRLFALYRKENGDEKQRTGLVLTFETEDEQKKKILTCNSFELSRMGFAGGKETISKITDYVEDWLVGYAKEHRYDGVAMGSHSYNTSANYSSRKEKENIEQRLRFTGKFLSFYSDVFHHDESKREITTRKNSCHWLWKK